MRKGKVRPVRHCVHICKVVYHNILKRPTIKMSIQEKCSAAVAV
jgi:hypothetical protein